ncbi:MAG: hypothetical protein V4479_10255 [Actinomycetota bacterium]
MPDQLSDAPFAGVRRFLVVPTDGSRYTLPERNSAWTVRTRGAQPGRYDSDRGTRGFSAEFAAAEVPDRELVRLADGVTPRVGFVRLGAE